VGAKSELRKKSRKGFFHHMKNSSWSLALVMSAPDLAAVCALDAVSRKTRLYIRSQLPEVRTTIRAVVNNHRVHSAVQFVRQRRGSAGACKEFITTFRGAIAPPLFHQFFKELVVYSYEYLRLAPADLRDDADTVLAWLATCRAAVSSLAKTYDVLRYASRRLMNDAVFIFRLCDAEGSLVAAFFAGEELKRSEAFWLSLLRREKEWRILEEAAPSVRASEEFMVAAGDIMNA